MQVLLRISTCMTHVHWGMLQAVQAATLAQQAQEAQHELRGAGLPMQTAVDTSLLLHQVQQQLLGQAVQWQQGRQPAQLSGAQGLQHYTSSTAASLESMAALLAGHAEAAPKVRRTRASSGSYRKGEVARICSAGSLESMAVPAQGRCKRAAKAMVMQSMQGLPMDPFTLVAVWRHSTHAVCCRPPSSLAQAAGLQIVSLQTWQGAGLPGASSQGTEAARVPSPVSSGLHPLSGLC